MAKRYVVVVGDDTVAYGDDEFLQVVNSNHVSICNGLAAILTAKLLPAAITHVLRNGQITI